MAVEKGWGEGKSSACYQYVFNHGFAKAFFGEHMICHDCGHVAGSCYYVGDLPNRIELPAWKHHLELMVTLEEPLKYLEGFL